MEESESAFFKAQLLCYGIILDPKGARYVKRSFGFSMVWQGEVLMPPFYYGGFKNNRYPYVKSSPFTLRRIGDRWAVLREGAFYAEVEVSPPPRFYDKKTSEGVEMRKIFPLCGEDCLLTGVVQECFYWREGLQCTFCGIPLNPLWEGRLNRKSPQQLVEVLEAGIEEGRVKRAFLSIGGKGGEDAGATYLLDACSIIKDNFDLPLQVELLPPTRDYLERLGEYADSFNTNIEVFDENIRRKVMPGKGRIPVDKYYSILEDAVGIFGENQVQSIVIVGLGESDASIIDGSEALAQMGVFPSLAPLRPTARTILENVPPPSADRILELSKRIWRITKDYGLDPLRNFGCVRCGGCFL
jgi:radical SAM protein (TIGR04043 family)